MSGTYPTSPIPKEIELISTQPSLVSTAESGKRQARNAGGHLFSATLTYPLLTREQFEYVNAFIERQEGALEEFQIVLPNKATPLGVASGSPLVQSAGTAGDKYAYVKNLGASIIGWLKRGDLLKFSGHNKVYTCTLDADTDISGNTFIGFRPPLFQNIAVNEVITVVNVPMTMYIDGVNKYKTSSPMLFTYKVSMVESP